MPRTPTLPNESANPRLYVRLYKVTLLDAVVTLRFVESDKQWMIDVGDGAGTVLWTATLTIDRDKATKRMDLQVDSMQVRIPNGPITIGTLGTQYLNVWAGLGVFDNGYIDAYVFDIQSQTAQWYDRWWFQGNPSWSYEAVTFDLQSIWGQCDVSIPKTIIQDNCNNVLGDVNCTINLPNFTGTYTVEAAPAPTTAVLQLLFASGGSSTPNPPPSNWSTLGTLVFTSSALAPLRRMVLMFVQSPASPSQQYVVTLAQPLPFAPSAGDVCTVTAGCDKTAPTCLATFNNIGNYRGAPYVPAPDAVYVI